MYIESAALAIRIRIANNTDQPFLVCDIQAHEDGIPTRPLLVPPHHDAQFSDDGIMFEAPLTLPLTIDPGKGVFFWIVVDAIIPSDLGHLLFELYGRKAWADETVKKLPNQLEKMSAFNEYLTEKQLSSKFKKAFGVELINIACHEVSTNLALKAITSNKSEFKARFGVLPRTAVVEVLSMINSGESPVSFHSPDVDKFHIDFMVGTGELRRISIDTKSSALWFI